MIEQLIYTSVDEVVEGVPLSGWRVKEQTEGLSEEQVAALLSNLRAELKPIRELDGFPSIEEIDEADRRLVQLPTKWGTALLHTAPAGKDTTRRVNTCNHVVLEVGHDADATGFTVDSWRAPWWLAPFGPNAVRDSKLPHLESIVAGTDVSSARILDFLSVPGNLSMLCQMAEIVLAGPDAPMVIVPVQSTDESALWIASLCRLMTPLAARGLGWSTLERVANQTNLNDILRQGFDLICVPEDDVVSIDNNEARVHVVAKVPFQPSSPLGFLLQVLLTSEESYSQVIDVIEDVTALISDQTGLTRSWAVTLSAVYDDSILGSMNERESVGVSLAISRDLLECDTDAWCKNRFFQRLAADHLSKEERSPEEWQQLLLSSVPTNVTLLMKSVAKQFAFAGANDFLWLSSRRPEHPNIKIIMEQWSANESDAVLNDLIEAALLTIERNDNSLARSSHYVLQSFSTDNIRFPPDGYWTLIGQFLDPEIPERIQEDAFTLTVASKYRQSLLTYISNRILSNVSSNRKLVLPIGFEAREYEWLMSGVDIDSAPLVAVSYILSNSHTVSSMVMPKVVSMLQKIEVPFSISPSHDELFKRWCSVSDLNTLNNLEPEQKDLWLATVFLREFGSQQATEAAREYLEQASDTVLSGSSMSVGSGAALLSSWDNFLQVTSTPLDKVSHLEDAIEVLVSAAACQKIDSETLDEKTESIRARIAALRIVHAWANDQKNIPIKFQWEYADVTRLCAMSPEEIDKIFFPEETEVGNALMNAVVNVYKNRNVIEPSTSAPNDPMTPRKSLYAKFPQVSVQSTADTVIRILQSRFRVLRKEQQESTRELLLKQIKGEDAADWLHENTAGSWSLFPRKLRMFRRSN